MLLRVPAASIEIRGAYQFFAGSDASGLPTWTTDASKATAVYTDPNGVGPFSEMSYVPGVGRLVYTNQHGNGADVSGTHSLLTMAEAPRPWGPWTVFYRNLFFPQIEQSLFQWNFAPKWFRDSENDASSHRPTPAPPSAHTKIAAYLFRIRISDAPCAATTDCRHSGPRLFVWFGYCRRISCARIDL